MGKIKQNIICRGLKIKPETNLTKIENWDGLLRLQEGQLITASMPGIIYKKGIEDIFFYFDGAICIGPVLDFTLERLYPFLTKLPELNEEGIFYFSLNRFNADYRDIKFEDEKLICQPVKRKSYKNGWIRKIPYEIRKDGSAYLRFNELPSSHNLGIKNYERIVNLIRDIEL